MSGAWSIDPSKFGDQVVQDHRRLCVAVAIAVDSRLVEATPVDTGRARGNWLPSIGAPRTDEVDARDAAAAVDEAVQTFNPAPEFPVMYLANNLPYIGVLNNGSSKQAPAGFVESSIDAAVSAANGSRL